MDHPPTIFLSPEPPPFPAPPRSVDLSPLEFILALIAVIAIPALIYTFFFSIRCPPSPFSRRHRSTNTSNFSDTLSVAESHELNPTDDQKERVSDVKYQKETNGKDIGSECPVCLSAFSDGEEVKQLSVCKHSFHAACIGMWLNSHSNCPVCRASIAPAPPNNNNSSNNNPATRVSSTSRRNNADDHQQGLPDAASLV